MTTYTETLGRYTDCHNGCDSVSNHQPHDCLLNRLFRRRSKKTLKLRVTGLYLGNSPGAGEFPTQMASYAENVSIWWRHHVIVRWIEFYLCDSLLCLRGQKSISMSRFLSQTCSQLAPSITRVQYKTVLWYCEQRTATGNYPIWTWTYRSVKSFLHIYWPFVGDLHCWTMDPPQKGQ